MTIVEKINPSHFSLSFSLQLLHWLRVAIQQESGVSAYILALTLFMVAKSIYLLSVYLYFVNLN